MCLKRFVNSFQKNDENIFQRVVLELRIARREIDKILSVEVESVLDEEWTPARHAASDSVNASKAKRARTAKPKKNEVILEEGPKRSLTMTEYLQCQMRDRGRNQATGNSFTPEHTRCLLFEFMFQHMNVDYPVHDWDFEHRREVNERKAMLLLMMIADLLMHQFGVLPPVNKDSWSVKKWVTFMRDGRYESMHQYTQYIRVAIEI